MGVQTNLESFYVDQGNPDQTFRGNNPFGIWIANGNGESHDTSVDIAFDAPFGSTLTSLEFAVGSYPSDVTLEFYDTSLAILNTFSVVQNFTEDPQDFYSTTSTTGIGGFRIFSASGQQIEGNTNIGTITATVTATAIPEPSSTAFLGVCLIGSWMRRRRR